MSPSSCLCLLTFIALVLPSRGQMPAKATPGSAVDQTSADTPVPVPDETNPEVQPTPPIPMGETDDRVNHNVEGALPGSSVAISSPHSCPSPPCLLTGVEATQSQTAAKTEIQQPTGMDTMNPATQPGTHMSREKGTTASPEMGSPSPTKEKVWVFLSDLHDSNENNPFYYDDFTLRKRGLLVAAVLFITGIIILTSGKCRQLSRMCLNRHR
nr:FXYD domain-containing ion transport regulator 5 isoform X2 [Myodes glareolus]XP_048294245.1 FXYD domain-containing ion transport regulator 5 isoform X2 [Myodes glareolus]XP_048294246.1 FXYD domain-containing ion transport regulator 5 isoform X2 [Myodes glareolus]XP_048294248.1 FXYD domain-containing ion transport regulator 5 isoform X2 [Myodes glareolus]